MNVLLSFVGFHDPFSQGLVGEQSQPGPILSLLEAREFDKFVLFSTPNTEKQTNETLAALASRHAPVETERRDIPLTDPTNYEEILKGLRQHLREIQAELSAARFFIGVNSGTPQMHASWVLLTASGEIPAHLLSTRPPRFVDKNTPLVSEVDVTSPLFPVVRRGPGIPDEVPTSEFPDLKTAVRETGLVADHPSMAGPLKAIGALADSDVPILLLGETGTGKEMFARLVRRLSKRPVERFVAVNCAALPENLVESILFGHKRGAFTGAVSDQDGKFVLADGGTLFLDEFGELPLPVQAKLLRVLQDGVVEPVGARRGQKVNARIVAATNRDLRKAIKKGDFREDLYYRLEVGRVDIPPLRDRRSDIPKIALHVLDQVNRSLRHPKRLTVEALSRLERHDWLGNVRDLENAIERSARLSRVHVLDADDLRISEPIAGRDDLEGLPEPHEGFSLEGFIGGARKQLMLRALEIAGGNQSEAARLLGVSPRAVHKFLRSTVDRINRSRKIFNHGLRLFGFRREGEFI